MPNPDRSYYSAGSPVLRRSSLLITSSACSSFLLVGSVQSQKDPQWRLRQYPRVLWSTYVCEAFSWGPSEPPPVQPGAEVWCVSSQEPQGVCMVPVSCACLNIYIKSPVNASSLLFILFWVGIVTMCHLSEPSQLLELSGFVRSWKTWKSHGILKWLFPGLEKSWKKLKS